VSLLEDVRQRAAGPLRVREVGADGAKKTVLLCHGYGAPDLVGLASAIGDPSLRYVFPEGPLAVDTGSLPGRAWWPVDMMRLRAELGLGCNARRDRRSARHAPVLHPCIAPRSLAHGDRRISEGAMITTDLVLGEKLVAASANRVFQSHGLVDPICRSASRTRFMGISSSRVPRPRSSRRPIVTDGLRSFVHVTLELHE